MSAFDKIYGYEKEKKELLYICDMMNYPEKYRSFGVEIPQAILLHGDPGLGKTLMAKAMIEESGRASFSCRKTRADGEFVDIIKKTFDDAIENAPAIVFLDDMDKFAEDNNDSSSNKEEFVVIQSCLEDIKGKDVFVIATANDIDNLPSSLVRAGRFGKQLYFSLPPLDDSKKILAHYLSGKKVSSDVDAEMIANILAGHSCAVLESVINEAGIYAAFEQSEFITKEHIIKAILRVVLRTVEAEDLDEAAMQETAYHEAGHAILAMYSNYKVTLLTIRRHGGAGGICKSFGDEKAGHTYEKLKLDIMKKLAGKAAVELHLGIVDMGAESDLDSAVYMARDAIETLCSEGFEYGYDLARYSEKQAHTRVDRITDRVYELVQECYANCLEILKRNKSLLDEIAAKLLEKRTLLYEDLKDYCVIR